MKLAGESQTNHVWTLQRFWRGIFFGCTHTCLLNERKANKFRMHDHQCAYSDSNNNPIIIIIVNTITHAMLSWHKEILNFIESWNFCMFSFAHSCWWSSPQLLILNSDKYIFWLETPFLRLVTPSVITLLSEFFSWACMPACTTFFFPSLH